jgi:hypothetical protein
MSYRVTVHKRNVTDHSIRWSNVYRVEAATVDIALSHGEVIAGIEANTLWDNYEVYKVTAATFTLGVSRTANVIVGGIRADGDPAVQLPLWNCVRVTFSGPTGRPSIRYIRCPLVEAEVTGFNLDAGFVTMVQEDYADLIVGLGYCLDAAAEAYTAATVSVPVQMRQQGWHRRTRPGFHRGYIAD